MLDDARKSIYWDACVWLSYINEIPERMPTIDAILDDSANPDGDLHVYTSAISQVEVAFATTEQQRGRLDPQVEERIDNLWEDRKAINLVEFHSIIATEARSIIRFAVTMKWALKPLDAIHISTAKWLEVAEMHTYDDRLHKFAEHVGFPITTPRTSQPKLLPG